MYQSDETLLLRWAGIAGLVAALCWTIGDVLIVGHVADHARFPLLFQAYADRIDVRMADRVVGVPTSRLIAGALFGAGLAVSGMADPARVRAFLDLAGGAWDPTLAFVMGGALLPMAIAWMLRGRLDAPLADRAFALPETNPVTPRLILGAALFGIGWGIAGLCPGPAIADLALRPVEAGTFVAAMLTGFALHRALDRALSLARPATA